MRLRFVTGLVYALLAFLGVATIAPQVRLALAALIYRYSYAPDLVTPWVWLVLALGFVGTLADAFRRLVARRKVGMARYAAILLLLGVSFFTRKYVVPPSRPTVDDGAAHLVARVELAADEIFNQSKQYGDDMAQLTQQWPDVLRDLGFYQRGAAPLRSRLVIVRDSFGPALAPPDGVRPGDVVLVLSRDRTSYWITCFRLDRSGRTVPVVDERGRAVVASASNGHVASRLDPLFPEYPNKEIHDQP